VFDFEGDLIESSKFPILEDVGISQNDLIVIEFKEYSKPWTIKNPCVPAEGKCEGCMQMKVLEFPCICKKVSYCTERCRDQDLKYH
jgi:ubiquitin carboxyl-terminal hydrolase 4/11